MRLIDADALPATVKGASEITRAATVTIKDMMAGLPEYILQAQAEALRKNLRASSHWEGDDPVCRKCGNSALYTRNGFIAKSNYCPTCGAKMFDLVVIKEEM